VPSSFLPFIHILLVLAYQVWSLIRMAQKNYSLVPCNQLLNEGLSLYDIEKEEKNLCVKKCCERR
jgi:hypothetical protein